MAKKTTSTQAPREFPSGLNVRTGFYIFVFACGLIQIATWTLPILANVFTSISSSLPHLFTK